MWDVVVELGVARGLVESFAGLGATYPRAIENAIRKFERGTLHVLVAMLFDHEACADQVSWETWSHEAARVGDPQPAPLHDA